MADTEKLLSLFVSILTQTFFTFVRSHFMSLSLFTAWHNLKVLKLFLDNVHKYLCWFERRYIVSRNSHCCILCNISRSLLSTMLDNEAAETAEINRIAFCKRILHALHK